MDRGYESLYAVKIAYYRHKWLHCKSQTVQILKCWPCAAVVVYFVQEKYFVIPTTNWSLLSYIWTLLLTFFRLNCWLYEKSIYEHEPKIANYCYFVKWFLSLILNIVAEVMNLFVV